MTMRLALCLAAVTLPLAACSGGGESNNSASANGTGAAQPQRGGSLTLAAAIGGNPELERLNRVIGNAGLAELLNGVGPYTLFAPTNPALDALGEGRADALASAQMRPQAAALLRAHIVPGTITRGDLEAAIGGGGRREAKMRTMADTMLTFTREGDAIVVASEDGARARLAGAESLAGNGAVQPVDGLLRSVR